MVGGAGLEAERNASEGRSVRPRPFGLDIEGYLFCVLGRLWHLAHLLRGGEYLAARRPHFRQSVHLSGLFISLSLNSRPMQPLYCRPWLCCANVGSDCVRPGSHYPSPYAQPITPALHWRSALTQIPGRRGLLRLLATGPLRQGRSSPGRRFLGLDVLARALGITTE